MSARLGLPTSSTNRLATTAAATAPVTTRTRLRIAVSFPTTRPRPKPLQLSHLSMRQLPRVRHHLNRVIRNDGRPFFDPLSWRWRALGPGSCLSQIADCALSSLGRGRVRAVTAVQGDSAVVTALAIALSDFGTSRRQLALA